MVFTGFWLSVLASVAAPVLVGVAAVPVVPPAASPTPVTIRSLPTTPPAQAIALLQGALQEFGGKDGFDADYGRVNRTLLQTLADAIDLVEAGAGQAPKDAPRTAIMRTWRQENQAFVRQLATDSGQLRSLGAEPLRYRLAEQAMYERIVTAVRRNAAALRDLAGLWDKAADATERPGG
ncbi:MAG: hypothetical protein H7338_16680 [Candidatus Sericytochromatia bacterium]|nr:hypothetical protein [Candidatus Sericytochromatia bacterium]